MFKRKEEINLSTQEIRTLISVGCIFEGNITVPEGLTRIDGEIIGNVSGKGGLIVGEKGFIKGNVDIMEIVIYGRVEGEIIAKSVEPTEHLKEEIKQHVKQILGAIAVPDEIEFVEKLPKTRSGKIMRRVLKAQELGLPVGDISTLED